MVISLMRLKAARCADGTLVERVPKQPPESAGFCHLFRHIAVNRVGAMLCQACLETHWTRDGCFLSPAFMSLYESRVEVIVTYAPSVSDACETHAPPVEKSIASLVLRLC